MPILAWIVLIFAVVILFGGIIYSLIKMRNPNPKQGIKPGKGGNQAC
ncbi:MAG: hypothetical protein ABIK10_00560 [candidate division WOR-3 bacterium]